MVERRMYMDPEEYLQSLYQGLRFETPPADPAPIVAWQEGLRRRLTGLLGGFPPRCELDPMITEHADLGDYTREAVIFRSRPDLDVFAFFLRPNSAPPRNATIICLHGHGPGVDDIVGIRPDGSLRAYPSDETYERDFALQCVHHGCNVLAVEQLGFGRRRHKAAISEGPDVSSCNPIAPALLMMNQTMIGHRVYDVIRAIDYLQTRDDVDPDRIACMGISGGGTITTFSAALDVRIKAAVVSGYINTFRDSIMAIHHCVDNYVPGILPSAEMHHIAGLIAPRALFVESGTRDPIFPIEAVKEAVGNIRPIYDALGASDRIGFEVFEGDHHFHGVGAFDFLSRAL